MPSDKQPHGTTFHQGIILAILDKHGPITSGDVATVYQELTGVSIAYNYQYIITRRMADRGLIKNKGGKKAGVFQWELTAKGKKLLANTRDLATVLLKVK